MDATTAEHAATLRSDPPATLSAQPVEAVLQTLDQLEALVRSAPDADSLTGLVAELRHIQRRVAGLIVLAGQRAGQFAAEGTGPPAVEVLSAGGKTTARQATSDAGRSRLAETFPTVGAGMVAGAIPTSHADALRGVVDRMNDQEVATLAEFDTDLAAAAERLPIDSFARRTRRLRNRIRNDAGLDDAACARAESGTHVGLTRDRRHYRLNALLTILEGTPLNSALHAEHGRLALTGALDPDHRHDQQLTQALLSLIYRGASAPLDDANARRTQATINVICDTETFHGAHPSGSQALPASVTETLDGAILTPNDISRLCCEAGIRRVAAATDGNVMATAESRTATATQRAGLFALYGACAITGADWSQIETHHVDFHRDGGKTRIDNLVPISRRWHHLIHDEGWRLTMEPDRTLHLHRPDGTHDRTIPPPTPLLERRRTELTDVPVAA